MILGVLLLVWILVQANQSEREMRVLFDQWVDSGRPNPCERIKELVRFEPIVEKAERSQLYLLLRNNG